MGIKNLKKWLREKYPEVIEEKSLYEFSNKKIAIDVSSFIYKYKLIYDTDWLRPFLIFLQLFKKCKIHGIIVFDGKAPPEKEIEQLKRREQRDKSMCNILKIQSDLEIYIKSQVISIELKEYYNKLKSNGDSENISRLLRSKYNNTNNEKIDVEIVRKNIEKKILQATGISRQDTIDLKELLTILGIPYMEAQNEAESLACYLFKQKQVCAVLTEDTDVLAYGSTFACDIDHSKKTCNVIDLNKVLETTKFTYENFLDFCIMCKCDYNENVRGLGTAKLYNLFKNHITIEEIMKCNLHHDYSVLKLERCRELFLTFGNLNINSDFNVPYWNSNIDFEELYNWLTKKNVHYFKDQIYDNWKGTEINFED